MLGSGTGSFPGLSPGRASLFFFQDYNSQRAVRERAGEFFCRKSALPLGPPTAARAGATQKPRDRGRWGPDGGRHGNEGAPMLGMGDGWAHVQVLQARCGTDKPPLLRCDGLGRVRALGIGADQRPAKGATGGGSGRECVLGLSRLGGLLKTRCQGRGLCGRETFEVAGGF